MGRPPKRLEELSLKAQRKLEGMSEIEILVRRAKSSDHVYYSSVRKKVRMSNEYLCADEEGKEKLLRDAVREAEKWRQKDNRTWQQKTEAMGYTRNASGKWEQNPKALHPPRSSFNLDTKSSVDAHEKSKPILMQEKEGGLDKGNPNLRTIMVSLSELGGNLDRNELETVERKVQDLIMRRADEDRDKSNKSPTLPTRPSWAAPIAVMVERRPIEYMMETGLQHLPSEEDGNKKRKRPSSHDGGEQSCHPQRASNVAGVNPNPKDSSTWDPGVKDPFERPQVPRGAILGPSVVGLTSESEPLDHHNQEAGQAQSQIDAAAGQSQPLRGDANEKNRNVEMERLDSRPDPPNENTWTLSDNRSNEKVKSEDRGIEVVFRSDSKPARTGFFDHLTW